MHARHILLSQGTLSVGGREKLVSERVWHSQETRTLEKTSRAHLEMRYNTSTEHDAQGVVVVGQVCFNVLVDQQHGFAHDSFEQLQSWGRKKGAEES